MKKNSPAKLQIVTNSILIPVTIVFGLGIACCRITGQHEFLFLIGALLAAAISLWCHILQSRNLALFLLLPFFFFIGLYRGAPLYKPPQSAEHIFNRITTERMATIIGTLERAPSIITTDIGPRTRLLVSATRLQRPAGSLANHTIPPANDTFGLVQLTVNGLLPPNLEPGTMLMAKALLSRVHSSSVPGSFNYKEFLANQGIWITGWVNNPLLVSKVHVLPDSQKHQTFEQFRFLPEIIRGRIATFLDTTLDQRNSSLYKAILIGDKADIAPEILEDFKAIGCMHILAISGMHMGLLAFVFISICNWLLKRSTWLILHIPVRKTVTAISLAPLTGYALIAGFNTPVVRALIMSGVLTIAVVFNRNKSIINSVAIAAFIILILNPASLFTVSFQLSFAAVIAIAALYPRIIAYFSSAQDRTQPTWKMNNTLSRKIINWLKAAMLISVTATAGTAPLLLHYFNRISLISPISNIVIEPFICLWALTIGLVGCTTIPFSASLAAHIFHLGSWGLDTATWLASLGARIPFSNLWFSTPSAMEIILYYVLLASLLYAYQYKSIRSITAKALLFTCLVLLAVIPATPKILRKINADTTVTVLDVGHGSATHIMLPQGKSILIDGGGPVSAHFNVGERLIAPFLWQQRISRIDGIIITHPHADHYNGLFFIIKRFRPKTIWINGQPGIIPGYDQLLQLARQLGAKVKICRSGTVLFQSGNATISCIANPLQGDITSASNTRDNHPVKPASYNDASLVLKLVHGNAAKAKGVSFLFPGDISREEESEVLAADRNELDADILLSPHHGSGSSDNWDFIEAVSPDYIVISTGKSTDAQFPTVNVKKYCQRFGTTLLTTAQDGTISFTISGANLTVTTL
jgi:competence protein ComEC